MLLIIHGIDKRSMSSLSPNAICIKQIAYSTTCLINHIIESNILGTSILNKGIHIISHALQFFQRRSSKHFIKLFSSIDFSSTTNLMLLSKLQTLFSSHSIHSTTSNLSRNQIITNSTQSSKRQRDSKSCRISECFSNTTNQGRCSLKYFLSKPFP